MRNVLLRFLLCSFLFSPNVFAGHDLKATTSFENVNFFLHRDRHSLNDQETFLADLEWTYHDEKRFKLVLHPRLKVDFVDVSRNRYLPNESYALFYTPHTEFSAGLKLFSWGVSNSYNPTDVLNRRDFEDNFYHPEKLGEVAATFKGVVEKSGPFSELTFFAAFFPFFQKAPLPELDTRFALEGTAGGVPYSLFDRQDLPDYPEAMGGAASLSATVGPVDLAFVYYHGPERNPGYRLMIDDAGALRLEPFYYQTDMVGTNLEAALGKFVLHFEGAGKITGANDPRPHDIVFEENDAVPKSTFQYVPGLDFTLNNIFGGGDLFFSVEYLGDAAHKTTLRNFRPFQNDLFFGMRYEFLNAKEAKIEWGLVKDLSNDEIVLITKMTTKLYKELKFDLEGVFVRREGSSLTPLSFFDNNSHVIARLSYSFNLIP